MERREFFKAFGALAITVVAAPFLIGKEPDPIDRFPYSGEEKTIFVGGRMYGKMTAHMEEVRKGTLYGVKIHTFRHPEGHLINVIKHPLLTEIGE